MRECGKKVDRESGGRKWIEKVYGEKWREKKESLWEKVVRESGERKSSERKDN